MAGRNALISNNERLQMQKNMAVHGSSQHPTSATFSLRSVAPLPKTRAYKKKPKKTLAHINIVHNNIMGN
jgi:hypothetical protein